MISSLKEIGISIVKEDGISSLKELGIGRLKDFGIHNRRKLQESKKYGSMWVRFPGLNLKRWHIINLPS
jgi:hypothetical protein